MAVHGLLIAVASLVEHRQALGRLGLVAVACGLSCSAVCGIFLDQGLNLCPLHWQAVLTTAPPGKSKLSVFLLSNLQSSLCILDTSLLSEIFSQPMACLFIPLTMSFAEQCCF